MYYANKNNKVIPTSTTLFTVLGHVLDDEKLNQVEEKMKTVSRSTCTLLLLITIELSILIRWK